MAENLCLGFGCRGKGFFAKVSGRLKPGGAQALSVKLSLKKVV
ncbi:hypothetical protein [Neisseria sicca]|nr:hypothetical protein [Neisseria sicca]